MLSPSSIGNPAAADAAVFEANLAALSTFNPRAATRVRGAISADIEWIDTEEDGALSAVFGGRALASRRRPLAEAETFAKKLDRRAHGCAVVLGFGVGHHVAAVCKRMGDHGLVIAYESDVSLLRAVMERVDVRSVFARPNFRLFVADDDGGAVNAALKGFEALVSVGVHLMTHAASTQRLGADGSRFSKQLTEVIAALRTLVVTIMMQSDVTIRNTLMNLDHYLARPGIAELKDLCAGRPAIVVSAGPSLRRNIELLKRPGVRERCLIVAVQTVLRPLLEAGIKPHFVTALDYHEISQRFYEGLTEESVRGVQLVAEPKANPAILDAFPGEKRLTGDKFLTMLLGDGCAPDRPVITPGATVAHLAYYLARWTGADPVMLIGQDLAFTDGQYYAAGAAIHDVWAGELNSMHSVEKLEWERIVRMRGTLERRTDHLGRPIYTDTQMATYLAQFERDFLADREKGLTTIDATEGGVQKAHTTAMALEEALARWVNDTARELPEIPSADGSLASDVRQRVTHRLEHVRRDVRTIGRRSVETIELLEKVRKHQEDRERTNRLIDQIDTIRDEVQALQPAFDSIQKINQLGGFKRFRADRELAIDLQEHDLTGIEEQRRRLERDIVNVRWIQDAADTLDDLLNVTVSALQGKEKRTRDVPAADVDADPPDRVTREEHSTIGAVVFVHREDVHGQPTDLLQTIDHDVVLRRTLERLAASTRVDRAVVAVADRSLMQTVRAQLAEKIDGLRTEVVSTDVDPFMRRSAIIARAFARDGWRGGIAHASAADEVIDPMALANVMARMGLDAAAVCNHDWVELDAALTDALVQRHLESPENLGFVFSQAPPGRGPMVMTRGVVDDLASAAEGGLPFVGLGAHLGYLPVRPQPDPIAKLACVQVSPAERDRPFRCDAGSTRREIASADDLSIVFDGSLPPSHVTIELNGEAHNAGHLARMRGTDRPTGRQQMDLDQARTLLDDIAAFAPGTALTLAGFGDPCDREDVFELLSHAKALRFSALHVRTVAHGKDQPFASALAEHADVISVDLLANSAETYASMHALAAFEEAIGWMESLLNARKVKHGRTLPWVVPRITRCDAVYNEIEGFHDRWLLVTGSSAIDPMPRAMEGARIQPLPKPRVAALRDAATRMTILSDGSVPLDERESRPSRVAGNVHESGVPTIWRELMAQRLQAASGGHLHQHLATMW